MLLFTDMGIIPVSGDNARGGSTELQLLWWKLLRTTHSEPCRAPHSCLTLPKQELIKSMQDVMQEPCKEHFFLQGGEDQGERLSFPMDTADSSES